MKNSVILILLTALLPISTLSGYIPLGSITQQQKNEFARRFEQFVNTTEEDSSQCCLLDFARILSGPTSNPLITMELIKLSKIQRAQSIIRAFSPYFNELPDSMKTTILKLVSSDKLIDLLNKRIANNGKVACAYYSPGYSK